VCRNAAAVQPGRPSDRRDVAAAHGVPPGVRHPVRRRQRWLRGAPQQRLPRLQPQARRRRGRRQAPPPGPQARRLRHLPAAARPRQQPHQRRYVPYRSIERASTDADDTALRARSPCFFMTTPSKRHSGRPIVSRVLRVAAGVLRDGHDRDVGAVPPGCPGDVLQRHGLRLLGRLPPHGRRQPGARRRAAAPGPAAHCLRRAAASQTENTLKSPPPFHHPTSKRALLSVVLCCLLAVCLFAVCPSISSRSFVLLRNSWTRA
jgi:hypothetical protein